MSLLFRPRDWWPWLKAEFNWRFRGKRYEIHLTDRVKEQLKELPPEAQEELMKHFDRLSKNPYSGEKTYEDQSMGESRT